MEEFWTKANVDATRDQLMKLDGVVMVGESVTSENQRCLKVYFRDQAAFEGAGLQWDDSCCCSLNQLLVWGVISGEIRAQE